MTTKAKIYNTRETCPGQSLEPSTLKMTAAMTRQQNQNKYRVCVSWRIVKLQRNVYA
ncbi:hypothetical protein KIN20_014399 [Parelaphostrongylus tenuis]|uniref:Uncharacterized protein n=1 Tax=Parelaphostrongylus tenuis TaxID=148309 RepID=A0AAD5MEW9_PARTN|nr:hypothetical protein KIN20_014399 [Parelaphostrongylus tenuis]